MGSKPIPPRHGREMSPSSSIPWGNVSVGWWLFISVTMKTYLTASIFYIKWLQFQKHQFLRQTAKRFLPFYGWRLTQLRPSYRVSPNWDPFTDFDPIETLLQSLTKLIPSYRVWPSWDPLAEFEFLAYWANNKNREVKNKKERKKILDIWKFTYLHCGGKMKLGDPRS